MWYIFKVVVKRSDLSNLGDRGSAEKVSNLLGVQDPCILNNRPRRNILGRAAWIGSFVTSSLCPAIVEKNNHCITRRPSFLWRLLLFIRCPFGPWNGQPQHRRFC